MQPTRETSSGQNIQGNGGSNTPLRKQPMSSTVAAAISQLENRQGGSTNYRNDSRTYNHHRTQGTAQANGAEPSLEEKLGAIRIEIERLLILVSAQMRVINQQDDQIQALENHIKTLTDIRELMLMMRNMTIDQADTLAGLETLQHKMNAVKKQMGIVFEVAQETHSMLRTLPEQVISTPSLKQIGNGFPLNGVDDKHIADLLKKRLVQIQQEITRDQKRKVDMYDQVAVKKVANYNFGGGQQSNARVITLRTSAAHKAATVPVAFFKTVFGDPKKMEARYGNNAIDTRELQDYILLAQHSEDSQQGIEWAYRTCKRIIIYLSEDGNHSETELLGEFTLVAKVYRSGQKTHKFLVNLGLMNQ